MSKHPATLLRAAISFLLFVVDPASAQQNPDLLTSILVSKGAELVFNTDKGHCTACHQLPNEPRASEIKANIGPVLANIKQRFPDTARLRDLIVDTSRSNPNTIMPPYGKHRILSEAEIDAVIAYLQTQ